MLVKKSLNSARALSIDRPKLFERLEQIVAAIKSRHAEVVAVYVFGSHARRDATGRSDLDVLVVLSDSSEEMLRRILRFRKFFDLEIPVDLLVYTEDEIKQALAERNAFMIRVLKEAVRL